MLSKFVIHWGEARKSKKLLLSYKRFQKSGRKWFATVWWTGVQRHAVCNCWWQFGITQYWCFPSENFSRSTHFCRFCNIDHETLISSTSAKASVRTAESYNGHVQPVVTAGIEPSAGIKFDSRFNNLNFFHVCQPGLPPCLGHDVFEAVVSYDLALYIRQLIKK